MDRYIFSTYLKFLAHARHASRAEGQPENTIKIFSSGSPALTEAIFAHALACAKGVIDRHNRPHGYPPFVIELTHDMDDLDREEWLDIMRFSKQVFNSSLFGTIGFASDNLNYLVLEKSTESFVQDFSAFLNRVLFVYDPDGWDNRGVVSQDFFIPYVANVSPDESLKLKEAIVTLFTQRLTSLLRQQEVDILDSLLPSKREYFDCRLRPLNRHRIDILCESGANCVYFHPGTGAVLTYNAHWYEGKPSAVCEQRTLLSVLTGNDSSLPMFYPSLTLFNMLQHMYDQPVNKNDPV